jgi:Outer membrane protein beta-barrel domain
MLKIYTITIALVALMSQTTTAQVKIGGSIGIGSSKAKTDIFDNDYSLSGITVVPVQLNAEIGLGKQVSLGTGLFLNSKGVTGRQTYSSGAYDQKSFRMTGFDIPLYLKIKVYDKQNLSLYPIVGAYTSKLTGGTITSAYKSNTTSNNSSKDIDYDLIKIKTSDYGFMLGFTAEYKIKNGTLFARPMYQAGLNDISTYGNEILKHRLTQLNIGYLYTLK